MVTRNAEGTPTATMQDGDAVIFNYRADRTRQITSALNTQPDFLTASLSRNRPSIEFVYDALR